MPLAVEPVQGWRTVWIGRWGGPLQKTVTNRPEATNRTIDRWRRDTYRHGFIGHRGNAGVVLSTCCHGIRLEHPRLEMGGGEGLSHSVSIACMRV